MSGILAGFIGQTIAVSLTPGNQTVSNGTNSIANFTETVAVVGGTATAYTWSLTNITGSWTISSGQGTSLAVAHLVGATVGPDYTCTINCAVMVNGQTYNVSANLDYARVS